MPKNLDTEFEVLAILSAEIEIKMLFNILSSIE